MNIRSSRAEWPGWRSTIWRRAVSEAGGLGLIGGASAPGEVVREEIRKAKELTKKPFGVNVM